MSGRTTLEILKALNSTLDGFINEINNQNSDFRHAIIFYIKDLQSAIEESIDQEQEDCQYQCKCNRHNAREDY